MKRISIVLLSFVTIAAVALWSSDGSAFTRYNQGCNAPACHGDFLAGDYVSLVDGATWNTSLHDGHQALVDNDCDVCHLTSPPATGVVLNSSIGIGANDICCVGCHGRQEDNVPANPGINGKLGTGLRQHMHRNGVTSCSLSICHPDADPVSYTPVGEDVLPPYYAFPNGHPSIPTDPCNSDGSEGVFGSTGLDNDGDNVFDGADTDCPAVADVAIEKVADNTTVAIGSDITYTLTITNIGPDAADVTLDDTLPTNVTFVSATPSQGTCDPPLAGVVSCDLGTVNAGGSATVIIVVTTSALGQVTNSVTLTGSGIDPDPGNNSDQATTDVTPSVDLSVDKTDNPDPVDINSTLTYTVTVTNNSSSIDGTNVTLTDTLPTGVTFVSASAGCNEASGIVTCDLGTVSAGATSTITIDVTPTVGGGISNTATVSGDEFDPDTSNNTATQDTTVNAPGISVSPTSINFGAVDPLSASSPVEATISNSGTADLTVSQVALSDKVNFILDLESGTCVTNPVSFAVDLDGAQAGTSSAGTGTATVTYDSTTNLLSWNISFSGLDDGPDSVTIAHFHGPAIPGDTAGIEVDIGVNSGGLTSPIVGSFTITESQEADFFSGLWYINIHTTSEGAGEIRGQVSGDVSGTLVITPGSDCTFAVVFTPQTGDQVNGTLTITSDASGAPTVQVSLAGNVPVSTGGGGGGGCAIVGSKAPILQGAGASILLLLIGGWYVVRRRKK